jgi:hypothetical protein
VKMVNRKLIIDGLVILPVVLFMGAVLYSLDGVLRQAPDAGVVQQESRNLGRACSISVSDDAQAETLADLARISAGQAEQVALGSFPAGRVLQADLGSDDGCLVYTVKVRTPSGVKGVKVDAGNGQTLYVDTDEDFTEEVMATGKLTPTASIYRVQ